MKIIITAGGTGGHIYPAIAIINKIKEKDLSADILYIGTTDRMEKDIIPKMGITYFGVEMQGLNRKNIFANFKTLVLYKRAIKTLKRKIKEFNPDIVIGCGGYISAPVLFAAHSLHFKTLIHEQNSIPGLSNRFIAKFADRICVSLPNSLTVFGTKKAVYTGNPRSEEIFKIKALKKEEFNLDNNKKLVIIVMGSLGSITMTNKLKELIPKFKNKSYQVLVITGKNYYDSYKDVSISNNVSIVPYLDNFINLLKSSDLIISRAGASTIAEITAIGIPSILVPSPYVTANHQLKNALELQDIKACKIIEEKDFDTDTVISEIDKILNDSGLYNEMHLAALSLGIVNSCEKIYNEIDSLVVGDKI